MSLNVMTIDVAGQALSLRLTSKGIMNYSKKHGTDGGSPVIAVLEAVNNIEAKADLLTNALIHPENSNKVKDGYTLLDLMADDPAWKNPTDKNVLILQLAREAGLLSDEDYSSLLEPVTESSKALIDAMSRLLTGKPVENVAAGAESENTEENPT